MEIRLTDKERKICEILSLTGYSNKEIANIAEVSNSTLRIHLWHIFKKFNARNRVDLVLKYLKFKEMNKNGKD